MLSFHQSSYLRALVERGHRCVCVVDALVEKFPERAVMGWRHPDCGGMELAVGPDSARMRAILDEDPEAIHVLFGIRSHRAGEFAWKHCRKGGRRFGILSERADMPGWKSLPRRLYYRWAGLRHGRKPDFIMPLGEIGVRWYASCHFPRERLFPLAYATESRWLDFPRAPRADRRFQIAYVGSLFDWKGPDLLLSALARLQALPWTLRLVGDGPMRARLETFVRRQGWEDRVEFAGYLAYEEAMRTLAGADLLVLPSRYDGWGAVVNEALMRGVPVVCSDRCGARDLVGEAWRGEAYPYQDLAALAGAIDRRILSGPPDAGARRRIRDWSRCIEGPAVADYIVAVMEHVYGGGPRPAPPWSRCVSPEPVPRRSPRARADNRPAVEVT